MESYQKRTRFSIASFLLAKRDGYREEMGWTPETRKKFLANLNLATTASKRDGHREDEERGWVPTNAISSPSALPK